MANPAKVAPVQEEPAYGYVLSLPGSISPEECERYAQFLGLSAEQRQALFSLQASYQIDWDASRAQHLPEIRRLSREAQRTAEQQSTNRAALAVLVAFYAAQDELAEKCDSLDKRLFDRFAPLLTDEQQVNMPRVLQHRERALCRAVLMEMPSAGIDLAWLVERLHLSQESLLRVDPVLKTYEEAVTPLMANVRKGLNERSVEHAQLLNHVIFDEQDQHRDFNAPEHKARHDAFQEAVERMFQSPARLEARLVQINRNFAPKIAAEIPGKAGKVFLAEFRQRAYPHVYPDPLDPTALHDTVTALPGLDDEHVQAIAAMWQMHQDAYRALSVKMEAASDEFNLSVARTMTSAGLVEYEQQWCRLRDQRWLRSAQFVQQMQDFLPEKVAGSAAPLLREFDRHFQEVQDLAKRKSFRGPVVPH